MGGPPLTDLLCRQPPGNDLIDKPIWEIAASDQVLIENRPGQDCCFELGVDPGGELSTFLGCLKCAHRRPGQLLDEPLLGVGERAITPRVGRNGAEHGPHVTHEQTRAEALESRTQIVCKIPDARCRLVRFGQCIDGRQQETGLVRPVSIDGGASDVGVIRHAPCGDLVGSVGQEHLDRSIENDSSHTTGSRIQVFFSAWFTLHDTPLTS